MTRVLRSAFSGKKTLGTEAFSHPGKGKPKTEREGGEGREGASERASERVFVDDCARVRKEEGEGQMANLVLPGWKEHKV